MESNYGFIMVKSLVWDGAYVMYHVKELLFFKCFRGRIGRRFMLGMGLKPLRNCFIRSILRKFLDRC